MKTSDLIAVIVITVATSITGVASADTSTASLPQQIQSAAGIGQVTVTVRDGVAVLFGTVETSEDEQAVREAALAFPGIVEVRSNLVVYNL